MYSPSNQPCRNPIIVALDFSTAEEALGLAGRLSETVDWFKVGLQLYTAAGNTVVRSLREMGVGVFLDLKFFDIPNTVSQAAIEATRLGVGMMTLHTLGGYDMMARSKEAVERTAGAEGVPEPWLLGVTILTSMNQEALRSVGIAGSVDESVVRLARSAEKAGLKGIVCSPREIGLVKTETRLVKVTPGIRAADAPSDDQVRTLSAAEAIREGADYLVVGRPITRATDPVQAAQQLLWEIDSVRNEGA